MVQFTKRGHIRLNYGRNGVLSVGAMPHVNRDDRNHQDWRVLLMGAWLPADYRVWDVRLKPDSTDVGGIGGRLLEEGGRPFAVYTDSADEAQPPGSVATVDPYQWLSRPRDFCMVITSRAANSIPELDSFGHIRHTDVTDPGPGQGLLVIQTLAQLVAGLDFLGHGVTDMKSVFVASAKTQLLAMVGTLWTSKASADPYTASVEFIRENLADPIERQMGNTLIADLIDIAVAAVQTFTDA